MKKILYDQQIFRKQRFGGISRYFVELMTGVSRQPGFYVLPKIFYSDNSYLVSRRLTYRVTGNEFLEKIIFKLEIWKLGYRLKKGWFDVFHPTYYDAYFLKYMPADKPFVLTVHDMIHESYYDKIQEYLSEETKHKMALVPKAAHIIAVSHYTKGQIIKYFPNIDQNKISVIYHGTNLKPSTNTKRPVNLPGNYLLFIGTKKHYKSFFWLTGALKDYLVNNNIFLVCAGGFDFDAFEKEFLAGLGLIGQVNHVAVDNDEDLSLLYKYADCMIFPSLLEGFGMPILEAFVNECPVVLSNSSCFPEIGGDAALYFEAGNKNDLLEKINLFRHDPVIRENLVKKGSERARSFTWQNTIDQHLKIYNSLIN